MCVCVPRTRSAIYKMQTRRIPLTNGRPLVTLTRVTGTSLLPFPLTRVGRYFWLSGQALVFAVSEMLEKPALESMWLLGGSV